MTRILLSLCASVFLSLLLSTSPAQASEDPVYTSFFSSVALGGYDPVAYFTENRPVEGSDDYSMDYQGAEWHFASAGNLALFQKNPEKYAPAYGGYCAWAVAKGSTAPGDPEYWSIENGRLYLNYNEEVHTKWRASLPHVIADADRQWPAILDK